MGETQTPRDAQASPVEHTDIEKAIGTVIDFARSSGCEHIDLVGQTPGYPFGMFVTTNQDLIERFRSLVASWDAEFDCESVDPDSCGIQTRKEGL